MGVARARLPLTELTVEDLKTVCRKRHLAISGTKADLCRRLAPLEAQLDVERILLDAIREEEQQQCVCASTALDEATTASDALSSGLLRRIDASNVTPPECDGANAAVPGMSVPSLQPEVRAAPATATATAASDADAMSVNRFDLAINDYLRRHQQAIDVHGEQPPRSTASHVILTASAGGLTSIPRPAAVASTSATLATVSRPTALMCRPVLPAHLPMKTSPTLKCSSDATNVCSPTTNLHSSSGATFSYSKMGSGGQVRSASVCIRLWLAKWFTYKHQCSRCVSCTNRLPLKFMLLMLNRQHDCGRARLSAISLPRRRLSHTSLRAKG